MNVPLDSRLPSLLSISMVTAAETSITRKSLSVESRVFEIALTDSKFARVIPSCCVRVLLAMDRLCKVEMEKLCVSCLCFKLDIAFEDSKYEPLNNKHTLVSLKL